MLSRTKNLKTIKFFTIVIAAIFVLSFISDSFGATSKKKKYKKRKRYSNRRVVSGFRGFQDMTITPTIGDQNQIRDVLINAGVSSVDFNIEKNLLRVRYQSSKLTAVDIMHELRGLGYSVVNII